MIRNLQVWTVQVEMPGHTNNILMNIGYSAIMLRKTYHRRENKVFVILFDYDLLFMLMKWQQNSSLGFGK